MNDDQEYQLTPKEQRAEQTVRDLQGPAMGAELKAKLRQQFVGGAAASGENVVDATDGFGARRRRRRRVFWQAAAAAFFAALAVTVTPKLFDRSDFTTVYMGSTGSTGELFVQGHSMDPYQPKKIDEMLHPGAPVKLTEGDMEVDFTVERKLAMQLAANSEATVPKLTPYGKGQEASLEVPHGEVRIATGPKLNVERLMIYAPLAMVEVAGTTFLVMSDQDSLFVAVLEGKVKMADADGTYHFVTDGKRRTVYRDKPAKVEDIFPAERAKLKKVRDMAMGD